MEASPSDSRTLPPGLVPLIEEATSRHLRRSWTCRRLTSLADRSSHPAALLHGPSLSVFAKVLLPPDAADQARAELSGLAELHRLAGVSTPQPVGPGLLHAGAVTVLVFEALAERSPADRTPEDWRSIGRELARVHAVTGPGHGWSSDGYFGPLRLDNRAVSSGRWADFYAERRVLPWLRTATDAGQLPLELSRRVEAVVDRLPDLVGPEPVPTLLHGDAQHHNFVSTEAGAVVIDASPHYGHPEIDLALVDYFVPVPADLFAGYGELRAVDPGFVERRELWRIFAYLAIHTGAGDDPWSRGFLARLVAAVDRYS